MNQVFELAGDLVPAKVAHDLMRLLAKGAGEDDVEADSLLRSSAVYSLPLLIFLIWEIHYFNLHYFVFLSQFTFLGNF